MDRFLLTPFFLDQPAPLLDRLAQPGWAVNRPAIPEGTLLERLAAIGEGIAAHGERSAREGARPVAVTGDCCAAIAAVTGLQRAGLAPRVLWLDAHGDFNTPATSPSGFVGGMPLAMLVGRGDQVVLERLGTRPVPESAVALFDARDLDPAERVAVEGSEVRHVRTLESLDALALNGEPVHVHLDADVLNPLDAPAMSYPAAGGPRLDELEAALARLARRARIASVSLTTWAMDKDAKGRTERAVLRLLDAVLSAG